jgi:hypothetical protein
MLVLVILGADKTTVTAATGNQEFHPVYVSIGNVHNTVRRGHRDAVVPLAFLSIPKGDLILILSGACLFTLDRIVRG